MDKNEIREVVKEQLSMIFAQKEEADRKQKTEEALLESASAIEGLEATVVEKDAEIASLTDKLEDVNTKTEEASEKVSSLESELEEKASEVDKVKVENETLKEQLEKANEELDSIKKDKLADERMTELETAGVSHSDSDAQRLKVREMSSEDFTAYKEELVSIRESVLAEIERAKEAAASTPDAGEDDSLEGIVPPPAKVENSEAASAMNLETPTNEGGIDAKAFSESFLKLMSK